MVRRYVQVMCLAAAALIGCAPRSIEPQESRSLPVVSGADLERYVAQSEVPVLVEFGVDFQCDRCSQMKTPIVNLADRFQGRADVIRVDFNANTKMVTQLGGTILPHVRSVSGWEARSYREFPRVGRHPGITPERNRALGFASRTTKSRVCALAGPTVKGRRRPLPEPS